MVIYMEKYLNEWESLINELSNKEEALIKWKQVYEIKSDSLIEEAKKTKTETGKDIIKDTYGGNNDKTRKKYVKDQLKDWDNTIQGLELSIDWIGRRISFLRTLIQYKTKTMED